jgi:hypothetical protein
MFTDVLFLGLFNVLYSQMTNDWMVTNGKLERIIEERETI